MKNKILLTLCFLTGFLIAGAQRPSTIYVVGTRAEMSAYYGKADRIYVEADTADYVLCQECIVDNSLVFAGVGGKKWIRIVNPKSQSLLTKDGPITSLPTIGFVPGTKSVAAWIDSVFYQSQPPIATITGGTTMEYMKTGITIGKTVTYTAGRQSATAPLSTVYVDGVSRTFTRPSPGGSTTGTATINIITNNDKTVNNTVTTSDGKSATASTTFSFLPKRYWGWISDTTGIGTTSFDDSKITALNSELNVSKVKSFSTGNPSGTQFLVYAYYSAAGDLTHFDMNGFPSIEAMNHVTRSFTNALGYTGQWTIYWSKNGQTLSSTVVAD